MTRVEYDTSINTLGEPKIATPIQNARFVSENSRLQLMMTSEELSELGDDTLPMEFEKAGPRESIYFDPSKTKCAIVTCGGLCPGINDVIRSIVMEAHFNYGVRTILGIKNGLSGFLPEYGFDVVELTPQNVTNIHHFGGTVLGSSREMQSSEALVDSLERMNINVLFIIGGDGSMRAAKSIVDVTRTRNKKISVIGIPKTIDNDINFITRSFGFDTAVEKATDAIQCGHVEATGVNRGIGLVKLMGREAGFIAAQATLALPEVNFLLVPEQKFEFDGKNGLFKALERRLAHRDHALIVCAEGAGQEHLMDSPKRDASGNPKLGDICSLISRRITGHFASLKNDVTLKFIDPSYMIRSVPANAADRVYCGFLGQNAVHAALAGKTGMVVTQLKSSIVHLPLELVAKQRRSLNISSDYWCSVMEATGQHVYFNPKDKKPRTRPRYSGL